MSGIVFEPVNVAFESAVQRIVDRKRKDESAVDFMQRVVAIRRALCPACTHWTHEHERPYGCARCACRDGYWGADESNEEPADDPPPRGKERGVSERIDCWCITCEHLAVRARTEAGDPLAMFTRRFIVCPDCGNKRCPKATHHDNECTRSNEPGQPGSAYAHPAPGNRP